MPETSIAIAHHRDLGHKRPACIDCQKEFGASPRGSRRGPPRPAATAATASSILSLRQPQTSRCRLMRINFACQFHVFLRRRVRYWHNSTCSAILPLVETRRLPPIPRSLLLWPGSTLTVLTCATRGRRGVAVCYMPRIAGNQG